MASQNQSGDDAYMEYDVQTDIPSGYRLFELMYICSHCTADVLCCKAQTSLLQSPSYVLIAGDHLKHQLRGTVCAAGPYLAAANHYRLVSSLYILATSVHSLTASSFGSAYLLV